MLLNLTWAQENIDQTIRTIIKIALLSSATLYATTTLAQSISYAQAEQSVLNDSYSTQANQALQQASQLEAEAAKGLSIMEMSHRSSDYVAVAEKAEADLRKLMNIPENNTL